MKLVSRLAAVCFVVALPLLLVTTNVRILTSDVGFFRRGFREYDAPRATGIAMPELDRAGQEIADYFANDAATLRIVVVENGQEASLFNARETQHMRDVKWLVRAVYRVNEVSLAFVMAYVTAGVLWARERSLRSLACLALIGVGAGFVLVAAVGALALTGFDSTWTRFHELVFANDLWRLDPDTDHLIQMFPQAFWEEATMIVGLLTLAEVAAIVTLASAYLFRTRDRRPQPSPKPAGAIRGVRSRP